MCAMATLSNVGWFPQMRGEVCVVLNQFDMIMTASWGILMLLAKALFMGLMYITPRLDVRQRSFRLDLRSSSVR